jgi:hypothetical protein
MTHATVVALDHHRVFVFVEVPSLFYLASTVLFTGVAKGEQIRLTLPEVQQPSAKDAGVLEINEVSRHTSIMP